MSYCNLRCPDSVQVTWAQALYFVRVVLLPTDDSAFLGLHSIHLEPRVLLQKVAANTCATTKQQGLLDAVPLRCFPITSCAVLLAVSWSTKGVDVVKHGVPSCMSTLRCRLRLAVEGGSSGGTIL